MRSSPRLAACAVLCVLAACASAPQPEPETGTADYVLVFLTAGAEAEVPPGVLQSVMAARSAHVAGLTEAGDMLLEGSFAPPRAIAALRAMEIFATGDLARAAELARADPAVEAGLLHVEVLPWRGPARLRAVPRLDRERRASLGAGATPRDLVRPLVLVTAGDADAAELALAPLREAGMVAFSGRFGGAREGRALFALLTDDEQSAKALLEGCRADLSDLALHPWFGPAVLAELAAAAD